MPRTCAINDINGDKITGSFYERELQKKKKKKKKKKTKKKKKKKKKTKKKQKELRNEKVIKRKGEKLHVKWKGYNNSFNSGIDKKGSTNDRIFSKLEIFKSKCES